MKQLFRIFLIVFILVGQAYAGPPFVPSNLNELGTTCTPPMSCAVNTISTDIVIDPRSFGAVGDDITDDTVALNAAIASAISLAGTVLIPEGKTFLTGTGLSIVISPTDNGRLIIRGQGRIHYTGNGAAISINASSDIFTKNLQLKDFSILGNSNATDAIKMHTSTVQDNITISNLKITGFTKTGAYGIYCERGCYGADILHNQIIGADIGIHFGKESNGTSVQKNWIRGFKTAGIEFMGEVGALISGGDISNNLVDEPTGTAAPAIGIKLNYADGIKIETNRLEDAAGAPTMTGISITNSYHSILIGNYFSVDTNTIALASTVRFALLLGNRDASGSAGTLLDNGISTIRLEVPENTPTSNRIQGPLYVADTATYNTTPFIIQNLSSAGSDVGINLEYRTGPGVGSEIGQLSFQGEIDANNSIFRLKSLTGGAMTEKMRVLSNGNIGVAGEMSPAYALTVGDGDLFGVTSTGATINTPQTVTGTDTGDVNPRDITVAATSDYVRVTCNDTSGGCTLTLGETGIVAGRHVDIEFTTANVTTIADSAGVQEVDVIGTFSGSTNDYISFQYNGTAWIERFRKDN